MTAAHELFTADSSAIVQLLNRGQSGTGLGRCGLSVVLGTALLRGAGLEWYEQGDAWHRVTLERPLPHDVADDQASGLADGINTLLSADTSPGSGLFRPCAPLAEFADWAAAFRQAGRELGALARSGTLQRGLREILSYHVIFHWNRLGLTARQQAILARAARDTILGPVPPSAVHHAFP
jgi:thiopeptide-type bacteriocin biosynthesis protein